MSLSIQCLRCYKRFPVTHEMVGQTVLCPSCMGRVYVTEGSLSAAKAGSESSYSPIATPPLVMSQLPLSMQSGESERSFPIGLVAGGIAAALLLVVVGGLVIWCAKPAGDVAQSQATASPTAAESAKRMGGAVVQLTSITLRS